MKTYIVDVFHEDSRDAIEFAERAAKRLKEHIERLSESRATSLDILPQQRRAGVPLLPSALSRRR
jgi:hypothetical protein